MLVTAETSASRTLAPKEGMCVQRLTAHERPKFGCFFGTWKNRSELGTFDLRILSTWSSDEKAARARWRRRTNVSSAAEGLVNSATNQRRRRELRGLGVELVTALGTLFGVGRR